MRKKIIITIFIIITILQIINPIKTNAFVEKCEIISVPAKIERQKALDQVSETTGLDVATGIILEPTVEFFTFIIDAIMSVFSSFMTQEDFEFVMVGKDKLDELPDFGAAGATYTIEDMSPYKNVLGILNIKYPRFTYSPEEIFAGKIALLDINFIDDSNTDEDWNKIRNVISTGYKVLRMIAIIGLLSVLIYTGIKIIISSNTKDKAKYKEMIVNWFIAVILVFSLHYIMAFILSFIEEIMGLLEGLTGVVEVDAGGTKFKTNLLGLARFQLQQQHFSAKVGYLVIYTALVVYTFKFTFLYFKRVLRMAFLTVIAPVVALTYPIDKMNGQAKGFQMWLKEFTFNALLQPMHYILYYILVTSSLTLAARNLIYGIVALMFISEAERLLKRIFGFDKASAGTVGGIAGAYAAGAIASMVTNFAKDPLHPFGGKKGSAKSGNGKLSNNSSGDYIDDYELPNDLLDDADIDNLIGVNMMVNPSTETPEVQTGNLPIPSINDFFSRYRTDLSQYSIGELGGLLLNADDPRSIEDILKQMAKLQSQLRKSNSPEEQGALNDEINDLKSLLGNSVLANEMDFISIGMPPQYLDGDARSTSELMDELIYLNEQANNMNLTLDERNEYRKKARKQLKTIKRRMAENQYIHNQGGAQSLLQQENDRINTLNGTRQVEPDVETNVNTVRAGDVEQNVNAVRNGEEEQQEGAWDRFKKAPVAKGLANVGKTLIKPAWDVDKDAKYNGKRLVGKAGKLAKGVAGVTVGVAAAAVQAGISITDGKYNVMEGVATLGAGIAGVSNLGQGKGELKKAYKEGANAGEDGKSIKEYSEHWFNRDDVISYYNKEFPGQGKEMRRRAVNNYITRGITDVKEQKKAIKFAELLKKERGMDEEEADKIAVATLQYKQSLAQDGNYKVLFDKDKRKDYLDTKVEAYSGAASRDSVRQLHDNLIENVRDFDRVNN